MGELTLNQSVNLNIIFMITCIIAFIVGDTNTKSWIFGTLLVLLIFVPTLQIIKDFTPMVR